MMYISGLVRGAMGRPTSVQRQCSSQRGMVLCLVVVTVLVAITPIIAEMLWAPGRPCGGARTQRIRQSHYNRTIA